jgi:hypothetical protein
VLLTKNNDAYVLSTKCTFVFMGAATLVRTTLALLCKNILKSKWGKSVSIALLKLTQPNLT